MAITIRVYKRRLPDGTLEDEVSYNGAMTNPAYFSVAVVPASGVNYAPDEYGITLYVKITSDAGEKALDLKVKAEPVSQGNPPLSILNGFEAFSPISDTSGEWLPCYERFVTVSVPGRQISSGDVIPVKLRVGAHPGDAIGTYQVLLHFIVYNIGS